MASNLTFDLAGVEKLEGGQMGDVRLGSPGWRVLFRVEAPRAGYEVAIFVEAGCPGEDVVRQAMHRFHLRMAELMQGTSGWRLPQAEGDRRSAPPSG